MDPPMDIAALSYGAIACLLAIAGVLAFTLWPPHRPVGDDRE